LLWLAAACRGLLQTAATLAMAFLLALVGFFFRNSLLKKKN